MKCAIKLISILALLITLAACGTYHNASSNLSFNDSSKSDKNNTSVISEISQNHSSYASTVSKNNSNVVSKADSSNYNIEETKEDNFSSTSKNVNSKNNSSIKNNTSNSAPTTSLENSSNTSSHEHIWGKWIHDEFPNPETGENGTSHRTCKICRKIETKELTPEEVHHMFTTDGLLYSQW